MVTIDRNSNILEKREMIKRIISSNPQRYNVMIDMRNGRVALVGRTKSQYYINIGKLNLTSLECTEKNIKRQASNLNDFIRSYNSQSLMCKSRVKSEYGERGLLEVAYVKTVCNPHYKCASEMILYDKNIIEYNLKDRS